MPNLSSIPAAIPLKTMHLQNGIFKNALQGISDAEALIRANDNTNHMNWILGHLVTCRYMLAQSLGLSMPDPNGKLYFQAIGDHKYNSLGDIHNSWTDISEGLQSHLEQLGTTDLEAKIDDKGTTRMDVLLFYLYHEAYHLGQLGILRKVLSLTPMKPY